MAFLCLTLPFKKFHAVAKRVAKLKAIVIWDRNTFKNLAVGCDQLFAPAVKIGNKIGNVAFCFRAVDAVFRPEMYLKTINFEPKSTSMTDRFRFCNFSETEYAAVKFTCLIFGSDRNADLRMVDGFDHLFAELFAHSRLHPLRNEARDAAAEFEDLFHQR